MGVTTSQAKTFTCDDPTCNVSHTVAEDVAPAGIVMTVHVDMTTSTDVYACRRPHIRGAILTALDAHAAGQSAEPLEGDDPADADAEGEDDGEMLDDEPEPDDEAVEPASAARAS